MNVKKQIKIYFVTPGIPGYTHEFFFPFISKYFDIVIDPIAPEYVIYSIHPNTKDKKYKTIYDYPNAIKIFFTGENIVPDFNLADYSLGFHNIQFSDRYYRYPLWYVYLMNHNNFKYVYGENIDDSHANRNFCNFIYSNNLASNSIREELFHKLSEYKKVDSAGKMLNNTGCYLENKMEFIKNYKFTLAIENSNVDGYVTEKIIEPKIMGSVPIYWGSAAALKDFNPKAFIYVNDFNSIDELKDYIEYLDNNSEEYLKILREPMFLEKNIKDIETELKDFFSNIFNPTIEEARRLSDKRGALQYHYNAMQMHYRTLQLPRIWRLILNKLIRYYK